MTVELDEILAVFLVDDDDAAGRFLKKIEAIEKADPRVEIVDAAIAHRTKLGRVKVHQTRDRGAMKGGLRGGAFGVVVGTILLGPAGAVVGGAAGGVLAGLHNRFHDIGIDDKFMREVTHEVEKGRSALFVLYQGDWANSIGAIEDAIKAEHALLIQSTISPEKRQSSRSSWSLPRRSSVARKCSTTTKSRPSPRRPLQLLPPRLPPLLHRSRRPRRSRPLHRRWPRSSALMT